MAIFLHAGLPRTATTILQRDVFPRLQLIQYMGKNPTNTYVNGSYEATAVVRRACKRHLAGDPGAITILRAVMGTEVRSWQAANQFGAEWEPIARRWASCCDIAAAELGQVLFSDEALSQSVAGMAAYPAFGHGVPIEQLQTIGLLERAHLSIVLRAPLEYLRASYYKAMELHAHLHLRAMSFDEYLRRQLEIHERRPSASRLFPACRRSALAHWRSLGPNVRVVDFEALRSAPHVIDMLLGMPTGERPVAMADLPRENPSWRNEEVNKGILAAANAPAGMTIEDYVQTFPASLQRFGLDKLFAEEAA